MIGFTCAGMQAGSPMIHLKQLVLCMHLKWQLPSQQFSMQLQHLVVQLSLACH